MKTFFTIRIETELLEKLRVAAEKDGRTVSGLVRYLILKFLNQYMKAG